MLHQLLILKLHYHLPYLEQDSLRQFEILDTPDSIKIQNAKNSTFFLIQSEKKAE